MLKVKLECLEPIPLDLRKYILKSYNHKCKKCLRKNNLDLHHIIPRTEGGLNSINNLIPLCRKCHIELEPKRSNPIIKNEYMKITYLISKSLLEEVKKIAIDKDTNVTTIVRNLLYEYVNKSGYT
jgi:5-methylcytosine-specific restriction endonuclease McrA